MNTNRNMLDTTDSDEVKDQGGLLYDTTEDTTEDTIE